MKEQLKKYKMEFEVGFPDGSRQGYQFKTLAYSPEHVVDLLCQKFQPNGRIMSGYSIKRVYERRSRK